MALHNLKAVFANGHVAARSATRPFVLCWLDRHQGEHWTQNTYAPTEAMMTAKAETITAAEYRAIKAANRPPAKA
jgi:hypothetical protein